MSKQKIKIIVKKNQKRNMFYHLIWGSCLMFKAFLPPKILRIWHPDNFNTKVVHPISFLNPLPLFAK